MGKNSLKDLTVYLAVTEVITQALFTILLTKESLVEERIEVLMAVNHIRYDLIPKQKHQQIPNVSNLASLRIRQAMKKTKSREATK
jgi:hypothetical protein